MREQGDLILLVVAVTLVDAGRSNEAERFGHGLRLGAGAPAGGGGGWEPIIINAMPSGFRFSHVLE